MTPEQTSDPTLWRYPDLYSPNRTIHLRNLESALAEEKAKLDHCLTANEQGTLQWWIQKHDKLREKLRLKQVELNVSDKAFNFHLKRANDAESQLDEARWLLGEALPPKGWPDECKKRIEWFKRRDAWLSAHPISPSLKKARLLIEAARSYSKLGPRQLDELGDDE